MVDRNALRTNQSFIIGVSVLGFILGMSNGGAWLILAVGVVLALGTLDRRLALFQQVYRQGLRRAGLLRPDLRQESASPHQFAQALGAVFSLAGALLLLLTPLSVLGWVLVWIVVVLAAITLFAGFCVGCFFYLQLDQRGWLPRLISDRAGQSAAAS